MDVGEWTKHGLVDWVVAAPFLTTDQYMPIGDMRSEMKLSDTPLYAGFEFSLCGRMQNPESLRATATSLYECGADGLYIFNFPCWTERITARPFHWLDGLNAPETSARKPLLFSVTYKRNRKEGVDMPPQLPAEIESGDTLEFTLYLPKAALPAWHEQHLSAKRRRAKPDNRTNRYGAVVSLPHYNGVGFAAVFCVELRGKMNSKRFAILTRGRPHVILTDYYKPAGGKLVQEMKVCYPT